MRLERTILAQPRKSPERRVGHYPGADPGEGLTQARSCCGYPACTSTSAFRTSSRCASSLQVGTYRSNLRVDVKAVDVQENVTHRLNVVQVFLEHVRGGPYGERMPRDTLTREKIIKAAIDLLDSEGLEGLNIRALGSRLGSAATAVYWHVDNKDNLIALAADQAWKEIALPDVAATGWRDAATAMAAGLHAMLTRHPWLLQAFGSFLLFGPGKARHDDHNLAIYEAAGFSGAQAGQAAATVFTFVLGNALGTSATASLTRKLSRKGGNAGELMREHVAEAIEIAKQFPRLRARLDSAAVDYGAAPGGSFEFGLRAILDGLEAELTTCRAAAGENGSRATAP